MDWKNRISIDEESVSGEPVIKGTRVPVQVIVGSLAGGSTVDEVCAGYRITTDDVRAALACAGEAVGELHKTRLDQAWMRASEDLDFVASEGRVGSDSKNAVELVDALAKAFRDAGYYGVQLMINAILRPAIRVDRGNEGKDQPL